MVTSMPRPTAPPDLKTGALRRAGALHPHPERVHDQAFLQDPFFDPRDRVQVRYEMVRRHQVEGRPVTEVAATFSVSRQAFYETAAAFEAGGLPGLLPKRPGPKRAHKCTEEILDFAEHWSGPSEDPDVTAAITRRFHLTIHPRSLERALARRKKKRAASARAR
jgi:transposase